MPEVSTEALQNEIRNLHGCESTFVESVRITESVPITETFEGATAWDGDVQVFDLIDYADADRAYAWSYEIEGGRRRFFVVLHQPPVDSPLTAVQALLRHTGRTSEP